MFYLLFVSLTWNRGTIQYILANLFVHSQIPRLSWNRTRHSNLEHNAQILLWIGQHADFARLLYSIGVNIQDLSQVKKIIDDQ